MNSPAKKEKFQRYGGSKVRSGCRTCKARRVKCDEQRLHDASGGVSCQRCLKARRTCGGYAPPAKKDPNAPLVMINYAGPAQAFSAFPGVSSLEQRSLDFFRTRTSRETFSSVEWSENLLRASYYDSAVLHAIVALSALHEGFQAGHGRSESDFAMQQYSKAINQVVKLDLSRSGQSTNIALITCVLFAAFESLQGHYKSALLHIKSGTVILKEEDKKAGAHEEYISTSIIRPFFLRFVTQSSEIADVNIKTEYPSQQIQRPSASGFRTVAEANKQMILILHHFTVFLAMLSPDLPNDIESLQNIIAEHSALLEKYSLWDDAFSKLIERLPSNDLGHLYVLRMWKTISVLMLSINIELGEMAWDEHIESFRSAVTLAESFVKTLPSVLVVQNQTSGVLSSRQASVEPDLTNCGGLSRSTEASYGSLPSVTTLQTMSPYRPGFTLDLGIIQPLFVVCTRCRDPVIRRRALQLLATCNRKEGLWDSTLTARVAERLIAIEEKTVAKQPILYASQLPEHVRIHKLTTEFTKDRHAWLRYTKSTSCPGPADMAEEFIQW